MRAAVMIRYRLKCANTHEFDGWFAGADAFDAQKARGLVTCAVCGATEVEKAVMAPAVSAREDAPLSRPRSAAEAALHALRAKIETESDYVGREFADEARRIHLGEGEARGIWGEADPKEAASLREDGIPITPLPFMRRTDG